MTLWCKKKPLPTQMHLYSSYMVPHMIPWGNYNFPRSTNKTQFLMKFPHLEKNVDLMKALKYEHQSIFPLWGRVKLNIRDRYRKQILFLINPAAINFFHQILKICHFGVRKKSFLTHMDCMTHIWSPTLFSRGIITFQGVLTKFNFSMKFPYLEKNC